ncbi:MAG: hypothetical protein KDE27_22555 [Planctomycetes bacterium]|nr:hypothetical protein [Planctomycetota bacterium]
MNEPTFDSAVDLGPEALQRRSAMLPELLRAVRGRRRRRQVRRLGLAAAALALAALGLHRVFGDRGPGRGIATPVADGNDPEVAATPVWTTFGNDPAALARCVVTPAARPEWYVDDDGLNDLLRAAKGRGGIVRAAGRVFVNAAAIDPWPQSE